MRSAWNRADGPSRDGKVAPPTCERPTWLACLEQGDDSLFEIMLESAKWSRPLGRWVRLLLWKGIRAPLRTKPTSPAGSSVWLSGLSRTTVARMDACLTFFEEWLQKELKWDLNMALSSAENANLSLRAYGRATFSAGKPRYQLVYAITGVQHLRPEFRPFLAESLAGRQTVAAERTWTVQSSVVCTSCSQHLRPGLFMEMVSFWCHGCFRVLRHASPKRVPSS